MKNKTIKISFIILNILFAIPSIIYWIRNKTVMNFNTYYNFFINEQTNKIWVTIIYLILFISIFVIYLIIIKKKDLFKNIKQVLLYIGLISIIYTIILPWTSSDIFYYMGVGELDGVYNQNPYYITMKQYYNENKQNIEDEILEQGAKNYWSDTTVVYGPVAQLIFKINSTISLKNIDLSLFVYKLLNIIVHIGSSYLIYKLTKRKMFTIMYGLNPFILFEGIGNVHNDIIIVFFILLTLYFLIKKKNILLSIIFLAIATGIKYFTILLLPVIVLYHFRKEKNILKRIYKCILYGLFFIIIMCIEYIIYFKDINILFAMFVQTERYSKSIHSVILQNYKSILLIVKRTTYLGFFIYYFKMCIDLLTTKHIKIKTSLRKYNIAIILFLLVLTNSQQWYLMWLFATIIWQKTNMIKNIIGISAITQIANSIYMFEYESYIFDEYYVGIIICLFIIWMVITNKKERRTIGQVGFNRWK